jgi:hypothetical protein
MKIAIISLLLLIPALAQAQVPSPGGYIEVVNRDGSRSVQQYIGSYRDEGTKEVEVDLSSGTRRAETLRITNAQLSDFHDYNFLVRKGPGRSSGQIEINRVEKRIMRQGSPDPVAYVIAGEQGSELIQASDLPRLHGEIVPEGEIPNLIYKNQDRSIKISSPTVELLDKEGGYPLNRTESRGTLKYMIRLMQDHPNFATSEFHLKVLDLYKQVLTGRINTESKTGLPDKAARDRDMLALVTAKDIDPNKVKWKAQEIEDFKAAARKAARELAPSAAR